MRFEAIYLDSTIDKYVEEIAAELLKASPDREKVLELAGELDSQSESEGKTRYSAARQVAERVYGLGSDSLQNTRPAAKTLASSVLALRGLGLSNEGIKDVIGKFPNIINLNEEYIEKRREYFGYTKEEFAKIVSKSINVLSNSEEHIEERRKYLGLDMKTFSGLVYKKPSVLSRSEDNLERRFGWYERHFGIKKEELVARLVEKPELYFSLFDNSFYTRVLLRTKAMTANGKTLNDVRELASVLKFNEKKFVEKHGNGISVDDYRRLKELARVTDEANPKKQKSRA